MNREDFPMLKQDIVYFDNGATTLKPQCVIDKMVDYYSNILLIFIVVIIMRQLEQITNMIQQEKL